MLGIKYSQALRKLYGYTDETDFPDIWESWMNCIVPEDREYVENSYQEAVRDVTGNTTYDVTYRSRRKDATVRWQRAAGYVMRQENGIPITCYGLVMDVDELEFTSRNRKKAKIAADHLLSLLNDVLQLSKLEDPDVSLSYEAFNVQELAEDILTIIKMRAVE